MVLCFLLGELSGNPHHDSSILPTLAIFTATVLTHRAKLPSAALGSEVISAALSKQTGSWSWGRKTGAVWKPYILCPRLETCFDLPCHLNSVDWLPLPELDCKVMHAFMRLPQSPLLKDLQTGPSGLVVRKCMSKMP